MRQTWTEKLPVAGSQVSCWHSSQVAYRLHLLRHVDFNSDAFQTSSPQQITTTINSQLSYGVVPTAEAIYFALIQSQLSYGVVPTAEAIGTHCGGRGAS
ncbi:hypothetical protein QE152_g1747 [Popillia japonica]|uniref:Uncharacterized protein n=1 Tax=Popillia japonica TaxID=7064 RepID=A0AAW1N395_POPJA